MRSAAAALLLLVLQDPFGPAQCLDSQVPYQFPFGNGPKLLRLGTQGQPAADLEKKRDLLAARLEGLRGLKFKTPVKAREGSRREYAQFVLENARRLYGSDLAAAEKGLKALGLIPSRLRLDIAITAQSGFAPKAFTTNGELVLIDPQATDDWWLIKMDLALVDQHFAPAVAPTYDAQLAFAALRMGDAEVVKQLVFNPGKLPPDLAKKLAGDAAAWEKSDSKLASAIVPRLFVRTGDFSWRRGAAFAMELYEQGGRERLDRAWAGPPASTEQVLHPEKYARGEAPVEIDPAPADEFLAGKGYKRLYRTVLGELGTALVLETHFSKDDLSAASEGWGGDTFAAYEKEGAPVLVLWATEWDTEPDAVEFQSQALRLSLKVMPPEPNLMAPVLRKKSSVAFGVNVPKELQDDLLKAVWKSKRRKGASTDTYGE